jgi:hypothetical protein
MAEPLEVRQFDDRRRRRIIRRETASVVTWRRARQASA